MDFPLMDSYIWLLIIGYPPRQWMVLGLVLWGFRLGLYRVVSHLGYAEDVRYAALAGEWGDQQDKRMLSF